MPRIHEQEVKVQVEPAPKQEDLNLTQDELKAFLDATIRNRARWCVRPNEASSFHENNEALIQKLANRVYDGVVSDFKYDKDTLRATRAVKFNPDYVAKAIRRGLESGALTLNEQALRESEELTEGLLEAADVEARIKGIANLVARESVRG